jgi:hypothetical protein
VADTVGDLVNLEEVRFFGLSEGRVTPHRNVDVIFRFARDSPLEGDGFELPVPGRETVKPSWEK